MICDECKRYRGMKDGMVRCWDSQLMILTCIPVPSIKRKKECPKWARKRGQQDMKLTAEERRTLDKEVIDRETPLELEALQICDLIDKLVRDDIVAKNELKAEVLHFCCRAVSMQRTEKEANG